MHTPFMIVLAGFYQCVQLSSLVVYIILFYPALFQGSSLMSPRLTFLSNSTGHQQRQIWSFSPSKSRLWSSSLGLISYSLKPHTLQPDRTTGCKCYPFLFALLQVLVSISNFTSFYPFLYTHTFCINYLIFLPHFQGWNQAFLLYLHILPWPSSLIRILGLLLLFL